MLINLLINLKINSKRARSLNVPLSREAQPNYPIKMGFLNAPDMAALRKEQSSCCEVMTHETTGRLGVISSQPLQQGCRKLIQWACLQTLLYGTKI
jgi:hypothetical protein